MKGKSIKGKSAKEILEALELSLSHGFKPTLAIVFLSIVQYRIIIRQLLGAKKISPLLLNKTNRSR